MPSTAVARREGEHKVAVDRFRKREGKHEREPFGSKMPKEHVRAAKELGGGNKSAGVERLMDIAIDAMREMGDEAWIRGLIPYAHTLGIYEGEALGRLALEGIKAWEKSLEKKR